MIVRLLLLFVVACSLALPAYGQGAKEDDVADRLLTGEVNAGNGHRVTHTVKLQTGQRYTFAWRHAYGSRAIMKLADSAGDTYASAGIDNDGHMSVEVPADGVYRLTIDSNASGWNGAYEISMDSDDPFARMDASSTLPPADFGDILITVLPSLASKAILANHGYSVYQFEIANRSEKAPHQIALTVGAGERGSRTHYSEESVLRLKRVVEAPPKSTIRVTLPQPNITPDGTEVQVAIDGKLQKTGLAALAFRNDVDRYAYRSTLAYRANVNSVLVTSSIRSSVRNNAFKSAVPDSDRLGPIAADDPAGGHFGIYREKGSPYDGRRYTYHESHNFIPAELKAFKAETWLAFGAFDGIVLTGKEIDSLPPETRAALWQYVECGGVLVSAGAANWPESWRWTKTVAKGCRRADAGFGVCFEMESDNPAAWSPDAWKLLDEAWLSSGAAWSNANGVAGANVRLPIVENFSVPVRGLLTFMLVFVLIAGPLNIFLLTRWNRRIWILWTVPVFSLLTTVALFGYVAITDGWYPHFRSATITVLDENSHRASTIGWTGYYSPTASSTLNFSPDAEITANRASRESDRHSRRSGAHEYSIDWTRGQDLDGGWIVPKIPMHLIVRQAENRLERLSARRDGDAIVVVNGLKADIDSLRLADRGGTIYAAENIPAGAEVRLAPIQEKAGNLPLLGECFGRNWVTSATEMRASNRLLRPGCYIAVLHESAFLNSGLRATQSRREDAVVYGIMKDAP